jgi:TPR repeat protein
VKYLKMAADHGNPSGQFAYGNCLTDGRGVSLNYKEAAKYFKLAADQGEASGQLGYAMALVNTGTVFIMGLE